MNIKNYILTILSILLPILILPACCSSLLTISTAVFFTTTWNDSRTIGIQLDDNILKTHITYTLYKHQNIRKLARIKNTVYQGNVLLTGQTPYPYLSEDAVKIIMRINGVKKVYNAIRDDTPISLQTICIDIWIKSKIYLNLFKTNSLNISSIKIITENKEVFLLGQVTHSESKYIEKIAKRTHGVKQVYTIFQYIK